MKHLGFLGSFLFLVIPVFFLFAAQDVIIIGNNGRTDEMVSRSISTSSGGSPHGGVVPCDGPNCTFADLLKLGDNIVSFIFFKIVLPSISIPLIVSALYAYMPGEKSQRALTIMHTTAMACLWAVGLSGGGWLVVNALSIGLYGKGLRDIFTI